MPTANDVIVHSLNASLMVLGRFCDDLKADELLHRITPKANCAAWTIGHLIVSERSALKAFGVTPPPLPDGFEKRFSRDEGCPQASEFGDVTMLMSLFKAHRSALIDAVKRATPEQLDKPLEKPHPVFGTAGELANFMAFHSMMHAGQISQIRRHLGRPPVM
ncbi:MAG: hypothetical protein QOF78_1936 [Phycisphaerales bacterium]|jgi:uncharacterized damage-inducible protein DinB|nr:hypothetical protein [Phycisphaerales bacterium]